MQKFRLRESSNKAILERFSPLQQEKIPPVLCVSFDAIEVNHANGFCSACKRLIFEAAKIP
jgi:hypothetical protein